MRSRRLGRDSPSATPTPSPPAGAGIPSAHARMRVTRSPAIPLLRPRRHRPRSGEMSEQVQTQQLQTQEPNLRARVEQALANIRPYIPGDGGDTESIYVSDGRFYIPYA